MIHHIVSYLQKKILHDPKKIVVLTGAGVSAESGLRTFRDSDGLWEEYRIEDVASPEGWRNNMELVLDFYNQRRRDVLNAKPNEAHFAIAQLEEKFEVVVVTQNIDTLHERAGSTNVIHLHGEILKSRSTVDAKLIYKCEGDILIGDKCEKRFAIATIHCLVQRSSSDD